jgi:hypothetical protein
MHGFEWKDQRGVEGTGFVRALRSLLTSHLPRVLPILDSAIAHQFEKELGNCKVSNGQSWLQLHEDESSYSNTWTGYRECPVFAMAKKMVTRTNCVVFFGPELCE